jgi:hypothetical protein
VLSILIIYKINLDDDNFEGKETTAFPKLV